MSKTFIHGLASGLVLLSIAAFVSTAGHDTTQTVLALVVAALGVVAFYTLPTGSANALGLSSPEGGGKVINYTKRAGSDGISTVRVWALKDGAQLEITVQRLGTLTAPLDVDVAYDIAEVLDMAGKAGKQS